MPVRSDHESPPRCRVSRTCSHTERTRSDYRSRDPIDPDENVTQLRPLADATRWNVDIVEEVARQRLNLYQFVGGSPLSERDPSGLLFGFGYGNYCGWSKRGQGGPPIDALDAACKRHDKCQATWWTCNPYHLSKCSFALCDEASDAKRFGCAQSHPNDAAKRDPCIEASKKVAALFCTITGQTISPSSPVFD